MKEDLKKFSWLKKLFASTFVLLMLLSVLTIPASASSTPFQNYTTIADMPNYYYMPYSERYLKIWNSNTNYNVPEIWGDIREISTPKATLMSGEGRLIYRYSPIEQNIIAKFPKSGIITGARRASSVTDLGEWG